MSPGRDQRPWSGAAETPAVNIPPPHDPTCSLCPGNARGAAGVHNPDYHGPYVFPNDFPALRPDAAAMPDVTAEPGGELLRAEAVTGECRVLCFGPRHDQHLSTMTDTELAAVINTWREQARELGRRWPWVQIFENRGAAMGASNPHPHGQIWASSVLPDEAAIEDAHQRAYLHRHGRRLLVDYAGTELAAGERVVAASGGWLAVVPYWAVWPFETMLVPTRPVGSFRDLDDDLAAGLAGILRTLLTAYDSLFAVAFPYSMGWHGAPGPSSASSEPDGHWQLHAHFYPPLLRSATVRKFQVGYEMLAGPQRDITPEQAAHRLRAHVAPRW